MGASPYRPKPKKKLKSWVLDRKVWRYLENDYAIAKIEFVNFAWWGTVPPRRVRHIGPYDSIDDAMKVVEAFVYKLNSAPHSWDEDDDGLSEAALRDIPKSPTTLCGLRKGKSGYGFEDY